MRTQFLRFTSFIILIGFISFYGCGNINENYFPLNEGWSWEYSYINLLTNDINKNKITNLSKRELQGKIIIPRKDEKDNGSVSIYFDGEDNDGVFVLAIQSAKDIEPKIFEQPSYLLKYPIKQGITWKDNNMDNKIESINDDITVPAGTFNKCIRIKTSNNKGEIVRWHAPGVGMVKQTIKIYESDLKTKLLLNGMTQLLSFKK